MAEGAPFISVDPTTGQLIATYPDGTVVPVEAAPAPVITSEGAPNATGTSGSGGTVTDPLWFATQTAGDASLSGTNRSSGRGSYSRRYSSARGYSSGYDGYDDDPRPPSYGDRSTHPFFGGDFRTPGGFFNAGDGGSGYRAPLEAPRSPSVPAYGGQADRGGGGGDVRGLISAWRDRLIGNAYPGGGSSGGYDDGSADVPRPERMRGQYARGLDPSQAAGLTLRPTAMLPRVFPGLGPETPAYQRLAALPAAQLAMLSPGYSGSPEDLANNLGRVYERAGAGKLPSTQTLIRNLGSGKGVEAMFEGEKAGRGDMESYAVPGYTYGQEPLMLGEATSAFGGLLDAALINEPLLTQEKYGSLPGAWGSYLTDKWASKALKRPVGKGQSINTWATKRLFKRG